MKRSCTASLILFLLIPVMSSPEAQNYYGRTDFGLASPGATGAGLYGVGNPALLNYVDRPMMSLNWADREDELRYVDRWGISWVVPGLGFNLFRTENPTARKSVQDYQVSTAFGNRKVGFGIGYRWSDGDRTYFDRENEWTFGILYRPLRHLSLGGATFVPADGESPETVLDLGLRPFGDERITLFGDIAAREGQKLEDTPWSAGLVIEPLKGFRLTGRYFEDESLTIGAAVDFGIFGLSGQSRFDRDGEVTHNTYGTSITVPDRMEPARGKRIKSYVELDLYGPIKYQNYRFFDDTNTLKGLLDTIGEAAEDDAVKGLAINLSGAHTKLGDIEKLWEIRERLKEFRQSGKHVLIYADELNINGYHFASVADRIILDPWGGIYMPGYLFGHTYYRGALDKLGLSIEEWRFFKYKSALEVLAREKASEADKEQTQRFVDNIYELAKNDVCEDRGIERAAFDDIVDNVAALLPAEALEMGLVDTLAGWDAVEGLIDEIEGRTSSFIPGECLRASRDPVENSWGEDPKIAVIYALGECAMDRGITSRKLVKDVKRVREDDDVRAVVLRVDSPGGSALASDIIAREILACREKKPVIVSQGFVAASGGYWLSMYGDKILAAPNTISGSIGVIGGWVYNGGLKEKLGFTTDHVKVGKHADLDFGMTVPFLGVTIPDRKLTAEEFERMEYSMKTLYGDFVAKVAMGRKSTPEEIEKVAQGRIWTGGDALANGLVDEIGGLEMAIELAREAAGFDAEDEVEIVELPVKPMFPPISFGPSLFGISGLQLMKTNMDDNPEDPMIRYLRLRVENNGRPLLLPPEDFFPLTSESSY